MSEAAAYQPSLYAELVAVLTKELAQIENGEQIARESAEKFCDENAGLIWRVPALSGIKKQRRDEQIRLDAQTMDVPKLMRKYGMSKSHIHRIIGD